LTFTIIVQYNRNVNVIYTLSKKGTEMSIEALNPNFEKPTDDYLRISTVSPEVAIADVKTNIERLTTAYDTARTEQVELLVCPELSLTGYSTADLFHNDHVLESTEQGLGELAKITENGPAMLVGAPLRRNDVLYNCAVMLAEGKVVGAVPKSSLPNYKEFYEQRWFTSGVNVANQDILVGEESVPFGTDVLFTINKTTVGVEICEDMFAPINPATLATLNGAEVIVNLSASNELVGKADYRKMLLGAASGKLICAYAYTSAGRGESVADVIYGGHQLISENGRNVAENAALTESFKSLVYDIDRTYLQHDRVVNTTWAEQASAAQSNPYRKVEINVPQPDDGKLNRHVEAHPYVPSDPEIRDQRCEEIFGYLSSALCQRMNEQSSQAIVLGLSGGLDSTLALLVAIEASSMIEAPIDIRAITMPGPASSERTQDNATKLAEALHVTHKVIPIGDLAMSVLSRIGHDGTTEDITYENAQARMRKLITMEEANLVHGMDLGTGDMSENAKGWCTYNGDHMSMFNPNSAVPKTLVKHLIQWYIDSLSDSAPAKQILNDIIATPISPELTGNGDLSQSTEDSVGPAELTDFFMHETLRHGSRPNKLGYLAMQAMEGFDGTYDEATIDHWLEDFMHRFSSSQWKRDVMPNGTKIGSDSLSPRGDHRMAPNTSLTWYK
jgi:NAD+ synthase (glutamine-hydrolysing)